MNAMQRRRPLPDLNFPRLQLARWPWPGSLGLRLALVTALMVLAGGALAGWLVARAAEHEAMPKETLERAVKKGAGIGVDAASFEHVVYEGFAPHQVAVMVECLTDNVKRTAPEMRVLFRKGQLGTSGSVAWDFDHVGMIEAEPARADADPDMAAIEAGAQDLEPGEEDGTTLFWTEPTDLDLVSRALPEQGFTVLSAKLGYRPKNAVDPASLSAEALEEVEAFLAAIDANDDVQNVYAALG